jgi:hypothetical protein
MSTRCDIIIKDYGTYEGKAWKVQSKLYHHHDGYPEGVGAFLIKEVLPKLEKSNNISCDDISNSLIKHKEDNEFECTAYNHVDIEYRYIIDIPKKEIRCLKGHYSNWNSPRTRFITDREVDLSELRPLRAEELYR